MNFKTASDDELNEYAHAMCELGEHVAGVNLRTGPAVTGDLNLIHEDVLGKFRSSMDEIHARRAAGEPYTVKVAFQDKGFYA